MPGRLAVTAMRTKQLGVTFVYSIYGVVGDELRTAAIWEVAHRHTLEHGMPFVIGGDHNQPPEVMAERWQGPLVLVCTKEPTCRASEKGSHIDYFGVHPIMEFMIEKEA